MIFTKGTRFISASLAIYKIVLIYLRIYYFIPFSIRPLHSQILVIQCQQLLVLFGTRLYRKFKVRCHQEYMISFASTSNISLWHMCYLVNKWGYISCWSYFSLLYFKWHWNNEHALCIQLHYDKIKTRATSPQNSRHFWNLVHDKHKCSCYRRFLGLFQMILSITRSITLQKWGATESFGLSFSFS